MLEYLIEMTPVVVAKDLDEAKRVADYLINIPIRHAYACMPTPTPSPTPSAMVLRVVKVGISSDPIANVPFNLTVVVANDGNEDVPAPSLSYDSTKVYPAVDALGKLPILACTPSPNNPKTIPPETQVKLVYTCIATWNFMASPELIGTLIDSLRSLMESALSDIFSLGLLKYAEIELPRESYKIFKKNYELTRLYLDTTSEGLMATAGAIELIKENKFTAGVSFPLVLVQHGSQNQVNVGSVIVSAPPYKFQALINWAKAKIKAYAVSSTAMLAATLSAPLAKPTFGLVPGIFLAVSVLAQPVTDVWYQRKLVDPVENYMDPVTIPSPPLAITSLPNNTYGQAAYHLYMCITYLNASVESSTRAYGALQANSTYYAKLQFNNAREFAIKASGHYENLRYHLNLTLNDITPFFTENNFLKGIQIMKEKGLHAESEEFLRATGILDYLNITWIKNLTFQDLDLSDIVEYLPNLGDYMEIETSHEIAYVNHLESSLKNIQAPSPTPTSTSTPTFTGLSTEQILGVAMIVIIVIAVIGYKAAKAKKKTLNPNRQ